MSPQGLGLRRGQAWVTQQGRRPHPGPGGDAIVLSTQGAGHLVSSSSVSVSERFLIPFPGGSGQPVGSPCLCCTLLGWEK